MKIQFNGLFLSVLTLLFVWAKLTGLIDWSWWIVFCPIWIPISIIIVLMIIITLLKIFISDR